MKTLKELEKALEESLKYFVLLQRAADSQYSHDLATNGIRLIEDTVCPKPIMESVEEIIGWVNVYQNDDGSRYIVSGFPSEEAADNWTTTDKRLSCQPIKVTVMREKKVPVERSARVCFHATPKITYYHVGGDPLPNTEFIAEIVWTEEPTT